MYGPPLRVKRVRIIRSRGAGPVFPLLVRDVRVPVRNVRAPVHDDKAPVRDVRAAVRDDKAAVGDV